MPRLSSLPLAVFVLVATLVSAASAFADMIPIADGRYVEANATYQGVTHGGRFDADFFQGFSATADPLIEKWEPCEGSPEDSCTIGDASSFANQISVWYPNGMDFSGTTSGRWGGEPSGNYDYDSFMRLRFRLDEPHRFWFYWQVDPGEWPSIGLNRGYITLQGPVPYFSHFYLQAGVLADSGKLGPGEYVLEARSWGGSFEEFWQGATYGGQFVCVPDTTTQLFYEPQDASVGCGGTATFSVGAPCTGATYQWRRNLVPLSNGGGISGAAGSTLTIQNACDADSGYYDVIVTCAGAQIPSRLARLGIVTTTAVATDAVAPSALFILRAAAPNPFGRATSIAYSATRPVRLEAAVYNAHGARVRTLMGGVASGSGAFSWDGATEAGGRAPAGIYFVRVNGEGVRETRKVVLME